jgi:hypothetical protein
MGMLQLWLVANTVLWPFSIRLGGITLNLNTVVLLVASVCWLAQSLRIAASTARVLVSFLVYLLLSLIVAQAGPCNDYLLKSILTMPILAFLILAGLEIGRRARECDWIRLQQTAVWLLLFSLSTLIVEMVLPAWFPNQIGYRSEGRLSGLFQEPSHVACALFPCIAILLSAESKRHRWQGTMALVVLLLLSRSSTLIALLAAWMAYRLLVQGKVRQTALFAIGIASLIVLGAAINYSRFVLPTVVRITGIATPGETENISSLVYAQGWQDAWFNLQRTNGMGLGVNRMGCGALPDVSARQALLLLTDIDLNGEDGSFLFAKVVSEAGIAGIAFYVVAIWWWVRLEKQLRRVGTHPDRFVLAAQSALIFCFVASSFIRGDGYFGGGLLLWVAAIGGASTWRQIHAISPAGAPLLALPASHATADGGGSISSAASNEGPIECG